MTISAETATAHITVLQDHMALVRAKAGVSVNGAEVERIHQRIAELLEGDYGVIIDREADYSVVPVEVFEVLNKIEHLRAVAIVAHRPTSATIASIDKALSRKPLRVFASVNDAQRWLHIELQLGVAQE